MNSDDGLDLNLLDLWSMNQSPVAEGDEDEVDPEVQKKKKKKLISM